MRETGFEIDSVEAECHLCPGGSPVAQVMSASVEALREKYVATGVASEADINSYVSDANDPTTWCVYYTTVRVVGRKSK
jgi:hypothetical protein